MKTSIKREEDTIVMTIDGTVDYETHEQFKENLHRLVRSTEKTDSAPKRIIVDLENLRFVGSSGISAFVQALKDFNSRSNIRPKYCNVASEFKKVIQAFDEEAQFEFFDSSNQAHDSYDC